MTLQREIIDAKQKQRALSGKMETVGAVLDREKTRMLEAEADRFMQELAAKGIGSTGQAERVDTAIAAPTYEIPPPVPEPTKSPKSKRAWPWSPRPQAQPAITDGEALYKVAISDSKVTIQEAIDIAEANNVLLKALEKKVEVAESKLLEAKRAMFPTLAAVTEESRGIAGGRYYKGRSYKINFSQPVFYGGELILTVKQAEENVRSSKLEYKKAKAELVHSVRTSYYGVVKAEYNTQYQTSLYEEVSAVHKRLRQEYAAKLLSEIDYLNVESKYLQVYFQAESARNDMAAAELLLRQALTLPADRALPLDLRLSFKKIDARFEEILESAYRMNADVKIKEHALNSAKYGLDIYKAKRYPKVDLRGSAGILGEVHKDDIAIDTDNADLDLEKEWFIGLTSSIPLGPNSVEHSYIRHKYGPTIISLTGSEDYSHKVSFNLLDKLADLTDEKSAQATLLQAQYDYERSKNELAVSLRDDFYNLQKALIQIDSSIAKIRYQEKQNEVFRYLLHLQETGAANFIEGLIEQASNKFSFIQAVADYRLAVSNLNMTLGDAYYFET